MSFYLSPGELKRMADEHLVQVANKGTRWFHYRRAPKAEYRASQVVRLMVQFASKIVEQMRKEEAERPRVFCKADEALGAWMSAALGDPKVCDQMKKDIEVWFKTFEDRRPNDKS